MEKIILGIGSPMDNIVYLLIPIILPLYFKVGRKVYKSSIINVLVSFIVFFCSVSLGAIIYYSIVLIITIINHEIIINELFLFVTLGYLFLFLSIVAYAIERQIFLFKIYENKIKHSYLNDNEIIGNKDEIDEIVKKHTLAAQSSILLFSGKMSWIEEDKDYIKNISNEISILNLCNKPNDPKASYLYEISKDSRIQSRFYPFNDPMIRARIMDDKIPERTKLVIIRKEIDVKGNAYYLAQVFTRKNGEVIINSLINLFYSLWNYERGEKSE